MDGMEKYVREVYDLARTAKNIDDAASSDLTLHEEERTDVRWELARLKSAIADAAASLIAIANRNYEP